MIRVQLCRNIFEAPEQAEDYYSEWKPENRVRDYLPSEFDPTAGHLVILNDRAINGEEVDRITPHDGSKIWLGIVPQLVEVLIFIVLAVVLVGVQYAITALTAPNAPGKTRSQEDSPSRNFDGIQDTTGTGVPVQWVYGKVRIGGHIIGSFEKHSSGASVTDGVTALFTLLSFGTGPYKSLTAFQINGNPVENIAGVTTETRLGTQDQAPLDAFGEVLQEVVYRSIIDKAAGEIRFQTVREVEGLEVIFRFPQGLFYISTDSGKMYHWEVEFKVVVAEIGGTFTQEYTKKCSGRTRNPFKAVLRITDLDLAAYEIRVTRLTADSANNSVVDTSEVFAISELTRDDASAHPGFVLGGIKQIPTEQLNAAVPTTYTCIAEGLADVRIYSSDTAYTLDYSNNPAWCFAHWLTWKVNGMGDRYTYEEHVDIPSLRQWAAYNDELVPDGKGGFEKRHTIGMAFDAEQSAQDIIQLFQGLGDCIIVKRGRKWTFVVDREDDILWTANPANIFPGTLKYGFLPRVERANRIHLTYQDEERDYQRESHPEELPTLEEGESYVDAQRDYFGATRRTEVARAANRMLLYNKLAKRRVEFEAGLDALSVTPGRLFGLNLITVGVGIAGGRILEVDPNGSRFRLDETVTLETGKTYEVCVEHESGKIDFKRLVSPPADTEWIIVDGNEWKSPLAKGAKYCLGEEGGAVEVFRCTDATLDQEFRRRITGLLYDPGIYTGDLGTLPVVVPNAIPDPRKLPPDAMDLSLFERQEFEEDGTITDVIDVDWTSPISALIAEWEVWYKLASTIGQAHNWTLAGRTSPGNTHFEIRNVEAPGFTYSVAVVSVSPNGQRLSPSEAPQANITTEGRTEQPPNLTGLSATIIDGKLVATVSPLTPDELGPGGFYHWKLGTSWTRSRTVAKTPEPRLELSSYPHGTVSILVKAVNSVGNESPVEASVSITLYGQIEENVVLTHVEAPTWSGTLSGFLLDGTALTLLEPTSALAPKRRVKQRGRMRTYGFGAPEPTVQPKLHGEYTTPIIQAHTIAITARADVFVDFTPIDLGLGTFDQATFTFDDAKAQVPFSGNAESAVHVRTLSRVSLTGTNEGDFGPWTDHVDRGETEMKYIQFRVVVDVDSDAASIILHDVKVTIDVPDRSRTGHITVSSATSVPFVYSPSGYFVEVRSLLVSVTGGAAGDTVRVSAESANGFTVEIRNAAGALTTGTVRYQAVGY